MSTKMKLAIAALAALLSAPTFASTVVADGFAFDDAAAVGSQADIIASGQAEMALAEISNADTAEAFVHQVSANGTAYIFQAGANFGMILQGADANGSVASVLQTGVANRAMVVQNAAQ